MFQNTGADGAPTVKRAPNAIGKGAEREMNTVKFWLEPALTIQLQIYEKSFGSIGSLGPQRAGYSGFIVWHLEAVGPTRYTGLSSILVEL